MKRVVGLMALLIAVLTVTPATGDFYVIGGGGRLGTAITTLPYTIKSPGLYYLNANLTAPGTNSNAITVDADDVTIDLMGFCLTGPAKHGDYDSGIVVVAPRTNVEIRNGTIKAFRSYGIQSVQSECTGIRVVGVRVREIGGPGISLLGTGMLVMDCAVTSTVGTGVEVGSGSLVKGCQLWDCWTGIYLAGDGYSGKSTAMGNTVRARQFGIWTNGTSLVADNTFSGQNAAGIHTSAGSTCTRNTVSGSVEQPGILALDYCTITNNTTNGLTSGPNCWLADNTVTP